MGKNYYIFSDGAAKGNPGPASLGGALFAETVPSLEEFKKNPQLAIYALSEEIAPTTNNQAEYQALLKMLEYAKEHSIQSPQVRIDSELIVRQLEGKYKVKNAGLKPVFERAHKLVQELGATVQHVPRTQNQIADYLANQAFKAK